MSGALLAFGADGRPFVARSCIGRGHDPYTGRAIFTYSTLDGGERAGVGHADLPAKVAVLPRRPDDRGAAPVIPIGQGEA